MIKFLKILLTYFNQIINKIDGLNKFKFIIINKIFMILKIKIKNKF